MAPDVLIRGGWVADGTGSPPFLGDVAIEDGRIAEVGRLAPEETAAIIGEPPAALTPSPTRGTTMYRIGKTTEMRR